MYFMLETFKSSPTKGDSLKKFNCSYAPTVPIIKGLLVRSRRPSTAGCRRSKYPKGGIDGNHKILPNSGSLLIIFQTLLYSLSNIGFENMPVILPDHTGKVSNNIYKVKNIGIILDDKLFKLFCFNFPVIQLTENAIKTEYDSDIKKKNFVESRNNENPGIFE